MITASQILAHLWGDFVLQGHWMATNKRTSHFAAFIHCLLYSLCFLPFVCVQLPLEEYSLWPHPLGLGATCYGTYCVRWLPLLVIFGTHFLIDRYGLARYVVWLKNQIGPRSRMETMAEAVERMKTLGQMPSRFKCGTMLPVRPHRINLYRTWKECSATGFPPEVPIWLSTWLLIIVDNVIHITINGIALRYL